MTTTTTTTPAEESTTIKHLVISSGGPAGHMMYSILRTLNLKGVWDIKNIKSIYGSSIGTYIAIILSLRYDWQVIDDYLIKRPWERIFTRGSVSSSSGNSGSGGGNTNDADSNTTSTFVDAKNKIEHILRFYNHHGLYGLKEFTETLRPALQGKDISVNVTLREFYEKTGIEVHLIATELNKFCVVDFNYKTHPNQSLIEACYMSCCYPFGFTPIYRDGCCYLDGGIINDYPVTECIRDQKCHLSEILGVKMLWETKPANISEKSSVLQFVSTFFNQIKSHLFENRFTPAIPNEVVCVSKVFSLQDWMNWIKDENYRRELVLRGETFANVFLSYRRNFHDSYLTLPVNSQQEQPSNQNVTLDTSLEHETLIDGPDADTTNNDTIEFTQNTTAFELHNNDDTTMV
jgi:predicted acylesterase/phospholipase RssA